jgi:ABC-2 type transport system permease protein
MNPARYLRLARVLAGASVSAKLEYRANFTLNLVGALFRALGMLLGLSVLFGTGENLGGWSRLEATVLVGVFVLVDGLMGLFVYSNLRSIGESIRTGSMDFTLLKPVDAQFMVSAREIDVFRLPDALVGIAFMVYGASGLTTVTFGGVLLGAGLLLGALGIVYALCFMLATTAFWFVRVENTLELFWGLSRAGQFPITAFPGWVRVMFTFIVPIAFITTVPASALIGRASPSNALTGIAVTVVLLIVARLFWRFAVRSYTSASS